MAYYTGETITDSVTVLDNLGNPVTTPAQEVFAAKTAFGPDFVPLPVTVGEGPIVGLYVVSFPTTPNLPGSYTIALTDAPTGTEYLETYDVEPAAAYTGTTGITLGDFRSKLGDVFADHLRLEATSDSAPGQFFDVNQLVESENAYMNSMGVMIESANPANVGVLRVVRASSGISRSLTLEEFPAPITTGDRLDLYNLGGHGFRVQFYNAHIRTAVALSYPAALIPISQPGLTPYSPNGQGIPIPPEFVAVHGISYDDEGYHRDVRPAGRQRGEWGQGWYVDKPSRTLVVDGAWRDDMDGASYTIHGYARHAEPTSESSRITLDVTWLAYRTAAMMCQTRLIDARYNNWAIEFGRLEQAERGNIWTPRKPNTVFL